MQVTSLSFPELSDRHVMRCARRHPTSYGVKPHSHAGLDNTDISNKKIESEESDESEQAKSSGAYVGGFREYLHQFASGQGSDGAYRKFWRGISELT